MITSPLRGDETQNRLIKVPYVPVHVGGGEGGGGTCSRSQHALAACAIKSVLMYAGGAVLLLLLLLLLHCSEAAIGMRQAALRTKNGRELS